MRDGKKRIIFMTTVTWSASDAKTLSHKERGKLKSQSGDTIEENMEQGLSRSTKVVM